MLTKMLIVAGLTITFLGLVLGTSLIEQSYPSFRTISFSACGDNVQPAKWWQGGVITDGTKVIACWVANVGLIIVDFVFFVFGTIVLAFNVVTLNIPGAPSWIRGLWAFAWGGTALYLLTTTLIRGAKGD